MRYVIPVLSMLVLAGTSQAHFLWLIPGEKPNTVKVIFSDKLVPDTNNPELIDKVLGTKLFVHDPGSKHTDLKAEKGEAALMAPCPDKTQVVRGTCAYGVFQRGDNPPTLINYYCILKRGELTDSGCFACQPFQIREEKPGVFLVEYDTEPLAEAEVVLMGPDGFKEKKGKTDKEGRVSFDLGGAPKGLYGVRAKHQIKDSGEHEGKKYEQITNYVTLVFQK